MIYLGISEEHDAGVTALRDGKIIFAANEERYTRNKFQLGFPHDALRAATKFIRDNATNIRTGAIGVASQIHVENPYLSSRGDRVYNLAHRTMSAWNRLGIGTVILGSNPGVAIGARIYRMLQFGRGARIKAELARHGLGGVPAKFFDHHYCHATSAYFTSGFDRCLVVTLDGAGDGYCSKAYACQGGKMKLLHAIPFYHSIGYYHALVTILLGFKPGRDGKVTGLSARGNPETAQKVFASLIPYDSRALRFENRRKSGLFDPEELGKKLADFKREDIAASMQKHLEKTVTRYIRDIVEKYLKNQSPVNISLAGGIFANVLLNQEIAGMKNIRRVFVHPHMGDGGLATGAAYAMMIHNREEVSSHELKNVYLGTGIEKSVLEHELEKIGLPYEKESHIEKRIAQLLSEGNVVVRVKGRMEYGPRALGHRSILSPATDPSICRWLNNKLNRSEFMPYAPAVLEEDAHDYFLLNGQLSAARFMTIARHVTELCKKTCPAIVHIDNTARPQIVSKVHNPDLYSILSRYKAITQIPVLINTSFNMHEEPIVGDVSTALRAFTEAGLEYMAIENFLIHAVAR